MISINNDLIFLLSFVYLFCLIIFAHYTNILLKGQRSVELNSFTKDLELCNRSRGIDVFRDPRRIDIDLMMAGDLIDEAK